MSMLNVACRRAPRRSAIECLSSAIRGNDPDRLRASIDNGAPVNSVDPGSGRPILHYAVTLERPLCVEVLLKSPEIDVDRVSEVGMTALDCAIYAQSFKLEIVKLLLDRGAKCFTDGSRKLSSFHQACEQGDIAVVEMIFSARKDELVDNGKWVLCGGKTPHHLCLDNITILTLLFEFDKQYDLRVDFAFEEKLSITTGAASSGNAIFLTACLERFRDDVTQPEHSVRLFTSALRSTACVRILLEHGCNPFAHDTSQETRRYPDERNRRLYQLNEKDDCEKISLVCSLIFTSGNETDLLKMLIELIPLKLIRNFERRKLIIAMLTRISLITNYQQHPLFAAIEGIRSRGLQFSSVLRSLLQRGFDPKIFSHAFFAATIGNDNYLNYISMLSGYRGRIYGVIAHEIVMNSCPDVLKELIEFFIECKVSVNETSDAELPSLMALALKLDSTMTSEIASILIEAGADLKYRRPNSPFVSSDIALTAALNGKTALLNVIVAKVGLNVSDLLCDLARFDRTPVSGRSSGDLPMGCELVNYHFGAVGNGRRCLMQNEPFSLLHTVATELQTANPMQTALHRVPHLNQAGSANNVAAELLLTMRLKVSESVRCLLRYALKSPDVLNLCRDVDNHFVVEDIDGLENIGDIVRECENSWESVYAEFEQVDRLKHMCRVNILESLLSTNVGNTDIRSQIESLPVPKPLKDYLSYSSEIDVADQ